jgi:hypothetical protein
MKPVMQQGRGIISWWDECVERGVIRTREDKKFYVHRSNIVVGAPSKGLRVTFEYDPNKPVREGFLPKAYKIVIEERRMPVQANYSVGAMALAGPLPSKEQSDDGR